MPTGTIVKAWTDATTAYMAVSISEPGVIGLVEYIGAVPLGQLQGLTPAQQKAALVAACKAKRDAQQATTVDLGLSGAATV